MFGQNLSETEIADGVLALDDGQRAEVIPQLAGRGEVLRRLPWTEWLERAPEVYADLAARVAAQAGLRELLPTLREALSQRPNPEPILSAGDFGDRDSVGPLLEILGTSEPGLRPLVVESLGRIGGPEARRALRHLTADDEPGHPAYQPLEQWPDSRIVEVGSRQLSDANRD